jgi:hypothetical protein
MDVGLSSPLDWRRAKYDGVWELPALGAVTAPTAVLIRPDGPVAWAGDRHPLGLPDALTTWFGPPTAAQRTGFRFSQSVHSAVMLVVGLLDRLGTPGGKTRCRELLMIAVQKTSSLPKCLRRN